MKDTLRLTLSRATLLPLSFLALSCGGGGSNKPPVKDPPQATLTVPKPNTAGQKLTVMVSATGCDQIQSLSIYDREDFLKSVPYSGPGAVSVDLAINEVKYTRGIAAQLSLHSRVVCTDGRQNDSQPQPATFFPAAEVVEAGNKGQLVPDNFVTDGSLPFINFIGCGNAVDGPRLYKVDKNGNGISELMPFACTLGTVVTPKHPTTKRRWVWTPNVGAMTVDENMKPVGVVKSFPLDLLSVGPDGDAIIYDLGSGGSPTQVARVNNLTGAVKWAYPPIGFVITSPLPRTNDVLIASVSTSGAPSGRANIYVARVDYNLGNQIDYFTITDVPSDDFAPTYAPPMAFSPSGNLLYMSSTTPGGVSRIVACATNLNGCVAEAQAWANPPSLFATITTLVPYAAGSRIAAIAAQKVWFLDANTGGVTSKGGEPLIPDGGLVVLQVQSGAPPFPQSFYFLTGPAPQPDLPAPQPLEIVATDDPAKGELYRFQIDSGTIAVAVDDSGTLWLRRGGDIVRPLTPAEYRQVRPVTP